MSLTVSVKPRLASCQLCSLKRGATAPSSLQRRGVVIDVTQGAKGLEYIITVSYGVEVEIMKKHKKQNKKKNFPDFFQ